jgi:serralysin
MKGADALTGGSGGDIFAFAALRDSKVKAPDTITDFGDGADRIALAAIGDFAFLLEEGTQFTGGAEIRWLQDGVETIVEVDADGDKSADMRIVIEGSLTLAETDFLL